MLFNNNALFKGYIYDMPNLTHEESMSVWLPSHSSERISRALWATPSFAEPCNGVRNRTR